jgi:hypothetical protein
LSDDSTHGIFVAYNGGIPAWSANTAD